VTAKTNILQNTAILKQIFLQVFAFFALYTNIVRVASAPHPMEAQVFVVQVSHIVNPFSKILKAKFPGYQTISHLPSLAYFSSSSTSSPIPIVAAENPSSLSCSIWSHITETNSKTTIIIDFSQFRATFARRGNCWKIKVSLKPVGRMAKTSFPQAKFIRQVFCSFLSFFMLGKLCRHSFKAVDLVASCRSRALFAAAIFLIDKNDPTLQGVDVGCQKGPIRGYTRSWYTGTGC